MTSRHLAEPPSRHPRRTSRRSSDEPPCRPASGPAGWRPGSRPRAGRTSPSSSRPAGPAAAAAVFTPNTFAAAPVRLSQAHLAATSGRCPRRVRLGRGDHLDQRLRQRRDRRRPATPTSSRSRGCWPRRRASPLERTLHLSTGIIGTRLPLDGWPAGLTALVPTADRRRRRARRPRRRRCARPTRSTKAATTTVDAARRRRATGHGHRQRDRQGRRDDPPPDGDDAVDRPDRRGRRARDRSGGSCGRPRRGPGTSSRSTATPAPTTRSSCWPPGRRARRRSRPGHGGRGDARRRDRGDRPRPRPPAGRRRRGRHDADHRVRAPGRATMPRPGPSPGRSSRRSLVKAAAHGRDPNWGRIAGAAGNARLADAAVLEAGRPARRPRPRRAPGRPADLDPRPAADLDRRPPRVRRRRRAARSPSIGRRRAPRWTPRRS